MGSSTKERRQPRGVNNNSSVVRNFQNSVIYCTSLHCLHCFRLSSVVIEKVSELSTAGFSFRESFVVANSPNIKEDSSSFLKSSKRHELNDKHPHVFTTQKLTRSWSQRDLKLFTTNKENARPICNARNKE